MSLFTGPGRNSEMSMMRSTKVSGANLPISSRWPGDSIWKHPSVRVDWTRSKVAGSSRGTASMSTVYPVDPRHLVERVRDRRLHPHPEDVELEQPDRLDVVLVELAHREAQPARLHRGAVEQRGVGEHHPARVQRDVAGQSVEALGQPQQQAEPFLPQPAGPQLGQLAQRLGDLRGPDVREGLRDRVDLAGRQPQRRAGVADGVPGPVGVHHRHAGAPLPAEAGRAPARRSRCGGRTPRRRRCRAGRRRSGERNRSISRP